MLTQFDQKPGFHSGLQCLKPAYCERLNSAIHLMNEAAVLFIWNDEEIHYKSQHREQLERAQEELLFNSSFTPIKQDSSLMQSIMDKDYRYRWMQHQKAMLDNPDSWKNFEGRPKRLAKCEEEWQKISLTSCWNHSQLVFIATRVLPELIKMQQESVKEIRKKRKKLHKAFYENYSQYLDDLGSHLKQARENIVEGMLYRLQAFDRLNHSPNVIRHFMTKVHQAGAKQNDNLPQNHQLILDEEEPLSQEAFQVYHKTIEQSGSKPAIRALHRLSWFAEDAHIPVKRRVSLEGLMMIPETLQNLVPHKPRWPKGLFKGHNFRHQFFHDKLFLLAEMNRPLTHDIIRAKNPQTMDDFKKLYQHVTTRENTLKAAMGQDNDSLLKQFSRFYQRKTRRLINSWNTTLQGLYESAIEEKLHMAELLSTQLKGEFDQNLPHEFSWEKYRLLQLLLKELKTTLTSSSKENLKARIQQIEKQSIQMSVMNDALRIVLTCVQKGTLEPNDLTYLLDYEKALKRGNDQDERVISFNSMTQVYLNKAVGKMNLFLKGLRGSKHPMTTQAFDKDNFIRFYTLVNQLGSEQAQKQLDKMVLKYFIFFMQEVLLKRFDEKKIEAFETFFEQVGKNARIYGKSVSERIVVFKQDRVMGNFKDLYPINCQVTAQLIVNQLADNRFEKDFRLFDSRIQQALDAPAFKTMKPVYERVIQLLVHHQTTTLEKVASQLEPYERTAVGLTGEPTFEPVKEILEMSALSHGLRNQYQKPQASYLEKRKITSTLRAALERFGSISTSSGKRPLFSKTYISDEVVLERPRRLGK